MWMYIGERVGAAEECLILESHDTQRSHVTCIRPSRTVRKGGHRNLNFRVMASSNVLSSPDLLTSIANNVYSDADLSALSRCNRTIRQNTLQYLFRDLEITHRNVARLAAVIKTNSLFASYCRTLSITVQEQERELEKKLQDFAFVINECLSKGLLTGFHWHGYSDCSLTSELQKKIQDLAELSRSTKTLRSLKLTGNLSVKTLVSNIRPVVCKVL